MFRMFILALSLLLFSCKKSEKVIDVFVPKVDQSRVLFHTADQKDQVLLANTQEVYTVMDISGTKDWVIISALSSNSAEAHGTNEKVKLYHVMDKRRIDPMFKAYAPFFNQYFKGKIPRVIAFDSINGDPCAIWASEDQEFCISLDLIAQDLVQGIHSADVDAQGLLPVPKQAQGTKDKLMLPAPDSSEILGKWLKYGISAEEVEVHLGAATKGAISFSEATGAFVQEWVYAGAGLVIGMQSADTSKVSMSVESFSMRGPSTYQTNQKVGIGSPESEVWERYRGIIDSSKSTPGSKLVAGSVYQGTLFIFKNGVVESIFIGAQAE